MRCHSVGYGNREPNAIENAIGYGMDRSRSGRRLPTLSTITRKKAKLSSRKCSFSLPFSVTIRAMKLGPEIEFHEDIRLFIYRPRGLIGEAAMNEVIGVIEDLEAKLQEPFNRFSDTVAADEVELNFKYVIHAGRPPVKSAILATDSTMIHYMRLHAILTQGSPITVRVFPDRQRAADWLGVPVERLSMETKDFG